jgi:hypothetical protein
MPFNTYTFIIFFFVLMISYHSIKNRKLQKSTLLIASYLFYSVWNPLSVLLLLFSTIVDWFIAHKVFKATIDKKTSIRFPTGKLVWEVDNKRHPKQAFWNVIEDKHPASVNFSNYSTLNHFVLPDDSHLDNQDKENFTDSLLTIIKNNNFLNPTSNSSTAQASALL